MNKLFKTAATVSVLALVVFTARLIAQPPAATGDDDPYLRESYPTRPFPDAGWDKATKGLGYALKPGKTTPGQSQKAQKKPRKTEESRWKSFAGLIEKIFVGLSAGLLLLAGIFIILQLRKRQLNKPLPQVAAHLSPEEEAFLSHQSLRDHQLDAERRKDFGAAVRFLYLRVLQILQRDAWIEWKKEKTNREYCTALKHTPFSGAFQLATRYFDRARYGSYAPDEHQYRYEIVPLFNTLLEDIEKNQPGRLLKKSKSDDYA